jgi:hypothetical protein
MDNYQFNPFHKKFRDIDVDDLICLREIPEGWYIEYKSDIIDSKKICKQLCGFANQYGGWLFFGIKEDQERKASLFHGINTNNVQMLLNRIRDAATKLSSPTIYYEEKVLNGPCEALGLGDGFSIVLVGIQQGADTPYICNDGRIYKRQSDNSEPIAENDRYALDALVARGKIFQDAISKLAHGNIEPVEEYAHLPVFTLNILSDPRMPTERKILEFDIFCDLFQKRQKLGLSVPFDNFYTQLGGYVARQIGDNLPYPILMTFEWWHEGCARISLPLNFYTESTESAILNQFNESHKNIKEFYNLLFQRGIHFFRIIDYSKTIAAISALYNLYIQICSLTHDFRDIYASFTLTNIKNTIPFIDDAKYLNQIREHGFPIMLAGEIKCPYDPNFRSMIKLEKSIDYDSCNSDINMVNFTQIVATLPIWAELFVALGMRQLLRNFDTGLFCLDKLSHVETAR